MSLDSRRSGSTAPPLPAVPGWLMVLALGLLSWAACALLPSIHRGGSLPRSAFALLPLGPLLLGGGIWLARTHAKGAPYVLLSGFPISLALSMSQFDHDTALATFSPGVLSFAIASLAGYVSAAALLCGRPEARRTVDLRPLGEVPPVDFETRRHTLGVIVLAVLGAGALGVVSWASWATPARFREQWGVAAPEGATLTALVAGLVGAIALSLVGPALRAQRGAPRPREHRTRRVTWLLLVALSGLVVYAMLRTR